MTLCILTSLQSCLARSHEQLPLTGLKFQFDCALDVMLRDEGCEHVCWASGWEKNACFEYHWTRHAPGHTLQSLCDVNLL